MAKSQLRLVLPDVHIPFQDQDLVDAWLAHAKVLEPDGVDILGDLADCYCLSRFDKNPKRKGNLQDEVDGARLLLEKIRGAVGDACDIRYSEGNHENRLRKVLWGKAPELASLRNLDIPSLLDLKSLRIKYYPPENPYQVGKLWYLHGDLARKCNWSMAFGGTAAAAVCKRVGGSVMMGHGHQMGHVCFRNWHGLVEGHEAGCLCNFNLEYIVGTPQWQQGWAAVDILPSGNFDVAFARAVETTGRKRELIYCGEILATLRPAKIHEADHAEAS